MTEMYGTLNVILKVIITIIIILRNIIFIHILIYTVNIFGKQKTAAVVATF